MLLEGKAAVVTGSAVGIGRAIAVALAEQGAAVAGLDIDAAGNAETARLVRETGRQGLAVDCDVADRAQVRRAMNGALQRLGRIDVLVNNAAIYADTSLTGGDYESQTHGYERSMAICALGSYYCARAAAPAMLAAGGGDILNVITEHIKEGHLMTGGAASGYDGAKWVQWRQVETWAAELAPHGIRVNAIGPGFIETPMTAGIDEADTGAWAMRLTPMRRMGRPAEVAKTALFLACEDSSFYTGAMLHPHGGVFTD